MLLKRLVKNIAYDHEMDTTFMAKPYPGQAGNGHIIDGARAQGIPADAIVAESAPAQFEVNLHHVADPMKACDYAVLLKRLIKNIAYDHEMDTTFMAKPYPGQAGNGQIWNYRERLDSSAGMLAEPRNFKAETAVPSVIADYVEGTLLRLQNGFRA